MLTDILLVFLAAAGLILVIWCRWGLLLLPVFGHNMTTLCFSRGDGDELEQRVRAFGWLRDGKYTGGQLVIVDCGLTGLGLERAQRLRDRHHWVAYCPGPALIDYIELIKDTI